jgi:hypothetical protein
LWTTVFTQLKATGAEVKDVGSLQKVRVCLCPGKMIAKGLLSMQKIVVILANNVVIKSVHFFCQNISDFISLTPVLRPVFKMSTMILLVKVSIL